MEAYSFSDFFMEINWLWYFISVIVVVTMGTLWYTVLFISQWIQVFKVDMPDENRPMSAYPTILLQLLSVTLFGLAFFILTKIFLWLALLILVAICGWQKGLLKFRYVQWKEYFTAAWIEAGYTFIAGLIFIFFALVK